MLLIAPCCRYAWSIASTQLESGPVEYDLHPEFMLQPPWDEKLVATNGKDAYIIHFTYGDDFDENGTLTPDKIGAWHLDKRDFQDRYPPNDFPMPPNGCTNEAVKYLVSAINEAGQHLEGWTQLAFSDASEFAP